MIEITDILGCEHFLTFCSVSRKRDYLLQNLFVIRNHNPLHKSYYEQFADGTVKCIDEEIPFEVPESWEWVKLGDIGK